MTRYCICFLAAAITIAVTYTFFPSVSNAAPRCYFMECEGDKPNPTPAAPSRIEPAKKVDAAPIGAARPRIAGEICANRSSFIYCASSVLAPQHGFDYVPANLLDNRLDTAWVEGKDDDGEGEWIVVDLQGNRQLRRIEILNGYHKNEKIFSRNNRVKQVEIRLSNGRKKILSLADQSGVQVISFNSEDAITWIQFIIRSVYPGTKYRDTPLSELRIITNQ